MSSKRLDNFGNFIENGDEIIIGQYYKQLGRRKSSSVFIRDKGPTFIYFHLVCAFKFFMIQVVHKYEGGVTIYTLFDSTLEHIIYVMEQHTNTNSDDE
jgi:hypothetical protein